MKGHHCKLFATAAALLMIAICGAAAIGSAQASLPSGWSSNPIYDTTANTKFEGSKVAALDTNDKLHVIYSLKDSTGGNTVSKLMYSDNTAGTWSTPVIVDLSSNPYASMVNSYSFESMAVDASGHSYIVYCEATYASTPDPYELHYATNAGGSWVSTLITKLSFDATPSFVMDTNKGVHLIYTNSTQTGLVYGTYLGGTYTSSIIASSPGSYIGRISIGIDPLNNVNIAYTNYTNVHFSGSSSWSIQLGDLHLLSNTGGTWQDTVIDPSHKVMAGSLAIDHNNAAQIIYLCYDGASNTTSFRYATNTGGSWSTMKLFDRMGYNYYWAQLAIGPDNSPSIAYTNFTSKNNGLTIQYSQVNIATSSSGTWNPLTFSISNAMFSYLAIGSQGQLDLEYYALNGEISLLSPIAGSLEYATSSPSSSASVPTAPTSFTVMPGDAKAVLSWSAPSSDGGATITAYKIYRGISSDSLTEMATVGSSTNTYTDSTVINGNVYYYKVAAVNSVGTGTLTNALSAAPHSSSSMTVPGPVSEIKATRGENRITLDWKAPSTGGSPSYILVYRSTSSSQPATPVANLSGSMTEYVDTSVNSDGTYYYWIVPGNSLGTGMVATSVTVGVASSNSSNDSFSMIAISIGTIAVVTIASVVLLLRRKV